MTTISINSTTSKKLTIFLRTALCLALLLCAALQGSAQTTQIDFPTDTWATVTPVKPVGTGSEGDPFIIAMEENLLWLTLNVGNTNSGLKGKEMKDGKEVESGVGAGHKSFYYKQTADLDLSAHEWIPIGNKLSNGFFGHYDGQGHTISGVRIDWSASGLGVINTTSTTVERKLINTSNINYTYGFFGWFGGHIENLVIDDAILYNGTASAELNQYDKKLSVFAGSVGTEAAGTTSDKITIRNIVINNSLITDCGKDPQAQNYMIGGLASDINSGAYSGTAAIDTDIQIDNVVVDVDVDMSVADIDEYTNGQQYYIGGVVGRMRTPRYSQLPKNTVYSGTINAKRALIGPILGVARSSAGTDATQNNYTKIYIGEFANNNSYGGVTEPNKVPETLYFTDYIVRGETITDTYPAESSRKIGNVTYSARTLLPLNGTFSFDAENMKMFQGVNHGTYLSSEEANSTVSNFETGNEFEFSYASSSKDLKREKVVELSKINRTDATTFSATFSTEREATASAGYTIKWYVVSITGETTLLTGSTFDATAKKGTLTYSSKAEDLSLLAVLCDGNQPLESTSKLFLDNLKIEISKEGNEITARLIEPSGRVYEDGDEGEWQWYGINGDIIEDNSNRFLLTGQTSSTLTLNSTNNNYSSYCVEWTGENGAVTLTGYWSKKDVVYVFNKEQTETFSTAHNNRFADILAKYQDGNDYNLGRTPETAVKTMERAYEILSETNSAADNIVVVMGCQDDNTYLHYCGKTGNDYATLLKDLSKGKYNRNATVTGSYGQISDGVLGMRSDGGLEKSYDYQGVHALGGATIFRDITFYGTYEGKKCELVLYCHLHDLTIANGVKVEGYRDIDANNNGLHDSKSPFTTFVGGYHNYDGKIEYPEGNAVKGQTTINIYSGCWGRVIAGSRNAGNGFNAKSHNIFGHPDHPHHVEVNVAIKHTAGKGMEEYAPEQATATGANKYKYDIGLLVGGQTDGTVYTEAKMTMMSGKVGRFISGNISYGRGTYNEGEKVYPSDGFYGSATLTLEGGEIGELVGGTLGRYEASTSQRPTNQCEAYFYGRSILNINGGTINGSIYGAGAGGVVGLHLTNKDDKPVKIDGEVPHTNDQKIPYYSEGFDYNGYRMISYGDYDAAKNDMPKMPLLKEDDRLEAGDDGKRNILDLAKSYCEVNITGGTIKGDVYGGGYGYSKQVAVGRALDQAGYLYGNSYVNITGGTIMGNVYGGGAGSDEYYKAAAEADKAKFEDLANVYGDTHVNISGGIIEGKVFAGSKGISGFPKMATLYGNTNLTIENKELSDNTTRVPIINNNIYGGSELGEITGNTNVEIKGGAIGNCIFGGSEGIEADYDEKDSKGKITASYKKTTAHIGGSTFLTVTDGTYFTDEYAEKISAANRISAAERTFNIYGGGYRNCIIEDSTNVTITKSLLASYKCLIEPDPKDASKKRKFEDCVKDETYRKFSVYGAGRGELTDVKKNANLTVNIEGGASVPSSRPVDVANNQQFFMIAGGGMAGHVWGNANVTLDGNVFARRVYGAGMYGNVLGDANMTVRRGSYYGVFGGGLLGNVRGNANLRIGTKAGKDEIDPSITVSYEDAAESNRNLYIYDNVYGGNDVSGCTGYETTDSLWNDGNYDTFVKVANKLTMTAEQKLHHYLFEHWTPLVDGYDSNKTDAEQPYYRHLIRASETKGVNMKIYGGKIIGDVFGAGNGNHTGYYVPNTAESESHSADDYIKKGIVTRMKFFEGLPYHYRVNKSDINSYDNGKLRSVLNEQVRKDYGLYEYRPRVAKVVMHIGGNSEQDRVEIGGDVYGGGHACTIGMYDPSKDVLTDPLKFKGGGSLHINFGSHVTVKKSVYMGSRGRIIGQQTTKGENDYNGITLNSDMDYHYYDATAKKYLLGFPNTLDGRKQFHAYVQLVNMAATTKLTFFDQTDNSKEVEDVRWGSFFAGGARGSMTKEILPEDDEDYDADKHKPYEYTLPAGLTVETRVVGGSEDAEITYYKYEGQDEGTPDFTKITDEPLFTFKGGIVYDKHIDGHFGGGVVEWHDAPEDSDEDIVGDESPRDSLTVMKLNVNCQFDPQKIRGVNDNYADVVSINPDEEEEFEDYYGGLVYGGCYNSGITNGSVEVKCTNNMLGEHFYSDDYHDYLAWSSLRRNIGRVYGGGFGEDATILGNTKVTLTDSARVFNVFGGGMKGDVTGGTEIIVKGKTSVYNAVYGGSLRGDIGKATYDATTDGKLYAKGTHIRLISGGVDRVYGGGFIGNVYGGTHIVASDEDQPDGTPRLMVGSIFGGNDVSGYVHEDANEYLDKDKTIANPSFGYTTDIRVNEEPREDKEGYAMSHESEKSDESGKFYGGYPLVGNIYGAGNGNMADYIKGVYIEQDAHEYRQGLIHIASGNGADYHTMNLGNREGTGKAYALPDIDGKTRITVNGGTIVNVYGGGSMCTVKGSDEVFVNYKDTVARAAVPTSLLDPMTWGVLRLFEDLQQQEVTTIFKEKKDVSGTVTQPEIQRFSYQIYRVFGGNNLMDMAIQPQLNLLRGQLFSVYSGGNFGRMTYIRDTDDNPAADQPRGLSLTIDSEDIRIASVYGGGRVGDIRPQLRIPSTDADGNSIVLHQDPATPFGADEFGATLKIKKGLIGEVYGGNNVAGKVYYGTNVKISGAISGNVYGSGNGNYIYYYDYDGSKSDPIVANQITEGYDEDYGGRYFILPQKVEHVGKTKETITDEEKIIAINSYRPNVDKAYLHIEGMAPQPSVGTEGEEGYKPARPARQVYVRGSVYCGGNSSTVLYNQEHPELSKIRFKIGNYVTLGGVFLGSNGEGLANSNNITWLGNLNGITDWSVVPTRLSDEDKKLYPNLLALYMRAAEVTALPVGFEDDFATKTLTEAHIGNFTIGGNRGSMMTDQTINMTLPESLVIFGRVVGGCYNSCVEYHGVEAHGGMAKPLAQKTDVNGNLVFDDDNNPVYLKDKLNLTIKSKFRPWRLLFNEDTHAISLVNDRTDEAGNYVSETDKVDGTTYYYGEDRCDIFGGCYTSGKTVGNINIDLYSDVLGRYEQPSASTQKITENGEDILADLSGRYLQVNRKQMMNNVKTRQTVYALTGAGYGPESVVEGDVRLRLMPTENGQLSNGQSHHPSISTIFGGAHNGKHIGKSTTEIRDGMVFSNLYAGSRAALKYGSSEVIVGYPKYYICKESGEYTLDRADKVTEVAKNNKTNHDNTPVIKKTVKYRKGDIVAANVFDQIKAYDDEYGTSQATVVNFGEKITESPTDSEYGTTWDKISINIGDNSAMNAPSAHFYGGGGIYGGGHALNESAVTYSGINTQLAFTADNNPDNDSESESVGYGGNSTIIVGDNTDANESQSHISIGTGHYVAVKLDPVKGDKIGKYVRKVETVDEEEQVRFVHQSSGKPSASETYYEVEADGGIYGDGRRTFVQGFRAVDITGYGYADYSPQSAKLINTFQRIDLLSLNDCCLQLQGAKDYATNNIDATTYSIARIGELRLNSTLTGDIPASEADEEISGNMALTEPRSRNYMGFFNNVHYVGAMVSNTDFKSTYRGADGKVTTTTVDDDNVKTTTPNDTYWNVKKACIAAYEAPIDASLTGDAKTEAENTKYQNFKKRNLATAPNMIGINNGYTLKLTNAYTTDGGTNSGMLENVPTDNIYYGPIIGVMEVKLLTLAEDEGGGYIYAFNQHEDKDAADETKGKTFLEETGNFVYPSSIDESSDNYIVDDCYPEGYYESASNATSEEVHYWYVQGHHYYFNTTLTAYTYNQNINFKLNNNDELILLSGITPATRESIKIKDIVWEEHLTDDDKCALTNDITDAEGNTHTREQYQLYLTIDKNTGNEYDLKKNDEGTAYTNIGNAFVARIPNGNGNGAYGTGADGKIQYHNNYSNKSDSDKNSPLLGIRLYDTDTQNFKPDFYKAHLDDDDNLVITITATDAGDGKQNTYTIRLKIVYLQGPYIDGKVTVENCALPGEFIYANTGTVQMEMDDALTVTGKKWYLYPRLKADQDNEIYTWATDSEHRVDVSKKYLMDNIAGDINRLQLPARYYQNDWKLGYSIVVNGQDFPLPEPTGDDAYSNLITVHNYHRMSTVASEIKEGTTYGYDLDLDLVGGALVYIEDDEDFEIFTKYVNYCNAAGHAAELPGDNAKGQNGRNVKNPAGAENIRFVLNADITLSEKCKEMTEFRGILNGNGHIINAGNSYNGRHLINKNYGKIHNLGVVSSGGEDGDPVFNENYGTISNSFYYFYKNNPDETENHPGTSYATLIGSNRSQGSADNCYQNTNEANADGLEGVNYRPNEAFQYGLVAYNLNQEYLKARYNSKDLDVEVHETMVGEIPGSDLTHPLLHIDYLYDYYADGDYRYANVRSSEHPEGLRLTDNFGRPNYENYMGSGKSMHETDKDKAHDERRWFKLPDKSDGTPNNKLVKRDERGNIVYTTDADKNIVPEMTNEGYFPIYLYDANGDLADHSDFIFFGQRLTPDEDDRQYYPKHIGEFNRVYRAGGFYGSRVDSAFHFNREAWVMQPTLTAIDFTGHLDVKGDDGYKICWQSRYNANNDTLLQRVYYPPVLDLPGGDGKENLHNLTLFDVVSNNNINDYTKVTKNLLVYTPETSDNEGEFSASDNTRLFSKLHYTRMQNWSGVDGETDQNDIIGHHLYWVNHTSGGLTPHFHASKGLFHLVDEQNFNAPIEFFVAGDDSQTGTTGRAWMKRAPKHYSSRISKTDSNGFTVSKDAWESIALPFTCNRVVAVNSGDYEKYSRGQITHFYGNDEKTGIIHHDYWLRGLVGADADNCGQSDDIVELVTFARPGSEEGLFHVTGAGGKDEQMRGDYKYENNWFYAAYKDVGYSQSHNEYGEPTTFLQYCYLTKNAPYIIAFPGEDYYEFDLSGNFYNKKHETTGCHPQEILYEFTVDEIDANNNFDSEDQNVRIPVTDVYDEVRSTKLTDSKHTVHSATFARIAGAALKDNMYILNPKALTNINEHGDAVTFPAGSVFVKVQGLNSLYAAQDDDDGIDYEQILPFRTYLTVETGSLQAPPYILIGETRGIDSIREDESDDDNDNDDSAAEEKPRGLIIWLQDNALHITSDADLILPLYGVSGQLYRRLTVKAGTNVYRNLNSGVYIVRNKKFVIRR